MKVLERLVLSYLRQQWRSSLDLLLLVYQLHLGLNNAIIYLVQHAHSHLDNTIQPQRLEEMLSGEMGEEMGVDAPPQHLDH